MAWKLNKLSDITESQLSMWGEWCNGSWSSSPAIDFSNPEVILAPTPLFISQSYIQPWQGSGRRALIDHTLISAQKQAFKWDY